MSELNPDFIQEYSNKKVEGDSLDNIKNSLNAWLNEKKDKDKNSFEYSSEVKISSFVNPEWDEVYDMERMYTENYSNNPELRDILISKFKKECFLENGVFFLLNYGGSNVAFLKINKTDNPVEVVLECVNLHKEVQNRKIGARFINLILEEFKKKFTIIASCSASDFQLPMYIESCGFVGNKSLVVGGNLSFEISINSNLDFESKRLSKNKLVDDFESGLKILNDGNMFMIKADDWRDVDLIQKEKEGYLLTRMFKFGSDNKWYVVSERLV